MPKHLLYVLYFGRKTTTKILILSIVFVLSIYFFSFLNGLMLSGLRFGCAFRVKSQRGKNGFLCPKNVNLLLF